MNENTSLLIWIPIGISVLSLGISVVALFSARFRPFTPDFSFGQPALGNIEIRSQVGKQQLVQFIIPCEAHNRGAKSGVIEDISISLSSEQLGGEICFFPHCFIKPNYIIEGQVKIEVEQPWSPIFIPPNGQVNYTIWFLNMHPTEEPKVLSEGTHSYVVKYRKLGQDSWITVLERTLKLDAMSMQHIMEKVGNLHCSDTGIVKARDKLVKKHDY